MAGFSAAALTSLRENLGAWTLQSEEVKKWGGLGLSSTEEKNLLSETRVAGVPAVLFPVVLNHQRPENTRTLWVKAKHGRETVSSRERESVEEILLRELEAARESDGIQDTKVEDAKGRVQVTANTIATFGAGEPDVRARSLGSI